MELAEPGAARTLTASPRPRTPRPGGGRPHASVVPLAVLGTAWAASRVLILLTVTGVVKLTALDVSSDVSVIYHGWYDVLKTGTFPLDDVTWQYPPGAALVILAPGALPWSYLTSFYVLTGVFDALAMLLLVRAGMRRQRWYAGAWTWVVGVLLLGPTVYARYDLLVTAVAVAGLLALSRRPRVGGALLGIGALLKVWPVLALVGTPRGRRTRRSWTAAAAIASAGAFLLAAAMNGAFQFLTFQRERGIEIESVGSVPIHLARLAGTWEGQVTMNFGSVEFLGPWVAVIARASMIATAVGFGWLLLWRLRADRWSAATPFDAALAALLIFTVTSRVISPQYMVWLVGLAAVCLTVRSTTQKPVAVLVLLATGLTVLEFPIMFGQVANSLPWGVAVLTTRNTLLLAATVLSCVRLWRATVPSERDAEPPPYGDGGDGDGGCDSEAPTTAYPVRPGITFEKDLLDDLDTPAGRVPGPARTRVNGQWVSRSSPRPS